MLETWGSFASTLGPDTVDGIKGADWNMVLGNPIWDNCHLSMQAISVMHLGKAEEHFIGLTWTGTKE